MPVPPSDTPGLVIAGVIGAGASIVTQVIASVVAGKREKHRFAWERDTQDCEWQKQERDRFLELKRELYSNFAFEISKLMGHIHSLNNPGDGEGPNPVGREELRRLQWNIDIIAPENVAKSVSDSLIRLIQADEAAASEHITRDRKTELEDQAESEWWKTYALLREDLGVSEPPHRDIPIRLPVPGPPPPRPAGPAGWQRFKARVQYQKMLRAYRRTVGYQSWWHPIKRFKRWKREHRHSGKAS